MSRTSILVNLRRLTAVATIASAAFASASTFPTPNPLDYKKVKVGATKDLTLNGFNGRIGSVIAFRFDQGDISDFEIVQDNYSGIQPTSSRSAVIRFKPTKGGARQARLRIRHVRFTGDPFTSFDTVEEVIVKGFGQAPSEIKFSQTGPANVNPSVRPRLNPDNASGEYKLDKISVEPRRFVAKVLDADGDPVPDTDVYIWVSGENGAGGHSPGNHAPASVHGWLAKTDEDPVDDDFILINSTSHVPKTAKGGSTKDSGSGYREAFTLKSDQSGEIAFDYIAPEVSGIDKIKVAVDGDLTVAPATFDVKVQLTVFPSMPISNDGTYELIGETYEHPDNHYGSAETISALKTAAALYRKYQQGGTGVPADVKRLATALAGAIKSLKAKGYDFPSAVDQFGEPILPFVPAGPVPIYINDMSLVWGGLFDISGEFGSPHGGHRWGNHADIKSRHLLKSAVDTGLPYAQPDTRLQTGGGTAITQSMRDLVLIVNSTRAKLLFLAIKASANGVKILPEADHPHVIFPQ